MELEDQKFANKMVGLEMQFWNQLTKEEQHFLRAYLLTSFPNIIEGNYNKDFIYSIPVDYSFCIEKDKDSENGKKGQFYYLEIFMKN